jgi:hypothetical protein
MSFFIYKRTPLSDIRQTIESVYPKGGFGSFCNKGVVSIMAVKKVKAVPKKKDNLLKMYGIMSEMGHDAVDREVLKRLKIIIDSVDDDISKVKLNDLLKRPRQVDLNVFSEALQPYVKHCVFMLKRKLK